MGNFLFTVRAPPDPKPSAQKMKVAATLDKKDLINVPPSFFAQKVCGSGGARIVKSNIHSGGSTKEKIVIKKKWEQQ